MRLKTMTPKRVVRGLMARSRSFLKRRVIKKFQSLPFIVARGNRESRQLYQKEKTQLAGEPERIARELMERGIALTNLDLLFPGERRLADMSFFVHHLADRAVIGRKKQFLRYLWGKDNELLDFDNPFTLLALNPTVLSIVSSYFELFPRFVFSSANITIPDDTNPEPAGSQRWHRDPLTGDRKICKVFLYLTDVTEAAGPFTYLPGTHATGKKATAFPITQPEGYYPKEGEVEASPLASTALSCLGPAGTVIFCDTSGLHYGGYSTTNKRIMATAMYVSPGVAQKPTFSISPEREGRIRGLPLIARRALGFSL